MLRVTIEGFAEDVLKEFGLTHGIHQGATYFYNGKSYMVQEVYQEPSYESTFVTMKVVLTRVPRSKSQEEIIAEKAVQKAKESLKAAEDVLNKVQEKK